MLRLGRHLSHETRGTSRCATNVGFRGEITKRIVAIAARQHGVVSLAQLVVCGLTASGVRDRVAAGYLHRVHQGVYAVGRADLTAKGRWMAAVLACGEGAVLSGASAAALHGMRASAAAKIDVTVTRLSTLARDGIRVHNQPGLTEADVTVIDGIPVTSVSRTLLDLAASVGGHSLERTCDQAVILEIFDMREMEDLLQRSRGRRGVRRLRHVLGRGDLGADVPASGLEVRYRTLCAEAGLPRPGINRYILLGHEYHKVDFLWRRERVVIETDGGRYHSTGWRRLRDAHRDRLLTEHGWAHDRVSDDEINYAPTEAVGVARRLLAARSRTRNPKNVA